MLYFIIIKLYKNYILGGKNSILILLIIEITISIINNENSKKNTQINIFIKKCVSEYRIMVCYSNQNSRFYLDVYLLNLVNNPGSFRQLAFWACF